jgi:NitT/TauT family transport system permease protein
MTLKAWLPPIIGFAIVLALWALATAAGWVNPLFLPSPSATWKAVLRMTEEGILWRDAYESLLRVFKGVGLAILIGVPVGFVLGLSSGIGRTFGGVLDFFRSIPPVIFYPLALLIFGIGDASRIAVVVLGAVTIIILTTSAAVERVSATRQAVIRLYGGTSLAVFRHVVIFETLPSLILGIRTAISLGIIIVTVTEMLVGATHGLGSRATNAQISYETPQLFAVILVVGLLGVLLNKLLKLCERWLVTWPTSDGSPQISR